MSLGIKIYLKQLGFTMLWIFSIICFSVILFGIPLKLHMDARIHQYKIVTQILERTPLTEVGYLVNKMQIIDYNAWLSYWQKMDNVPIINLFIPDTIKDLEPIKLEPWVSYSVPGITIPDSIEDRSIKDSKNKARVKSTVIVIIKGRHVKVEGF